MSIETSQKALDNYKKTEKLGEGTYGVVYKATELGTLREVALKKIKIDPNDEGIPATTIRELSLLIECEHPCIVKLEKALCVKGELFLVFEFMNNDLKKHLDQWPHKQLLPIKTLKKLSYMMIEGVRYCHSRRILHRDLKPQNILISKDGQLKIADFGLGREHGLPITKLTHEVVTLWYRPPEILLGQERYSGAADMWGVGCIMAEIATRSPLFPGDCEIDQLFQIFQILGTPNEHIWPGVTSLPDYKPTFPQWKSKEFGKILKNRFDSNGLNLMKALLNYAPNKRISAKQSLQHPWFDDIRDEMNKTFLPFRNEQEKLFQSLKNKYFKSKAKLSNQLINNNNNNNNNMFGSNSNNAIFKSNANDENVNPNVMRHNNNQQRLNNNNNNNNNNQQRKPTPMDIE